MFYGGWVSSRALMYLSSEEEEVEGEEGSGLRRDFRRSRAKMRERTKVWEEKEEEEEGKPRDGGGDGGDGFYLREWGFAVGGGGVPREAECLEVVEVVVVLGGERGDKEEGVGEEKEVDESGGLLVVVVVVVAAVANEVGAGGAG